MVIRRNISSQSVLSAGSPKIGTFRTLILNGLAFFFARSSQTFRFSVGTSWEHVGEHSKNY